VSEEVIHLIRPATESDLDAIARIQRASPQASQWAPDHYLAHRCVVAEVDDKVAGFLVSREIAAGEREILNLAVDPAHRKKGIARALMADELRCHQGEWFLEVRASNTEALNLYESLHFKRVAVRNHYYNSPAESAIVMRIFS
jgi:ribosomal-protein-alanine N-acetyltransferase